MPASTDRKLALQQQLVNENRRTSIALAGQIILGTFIALLAIATIVFSMAVLASVLATSGPVAAMIGGFSIGVAAAVIFAPLLLAFKTIDKYRVSTLEKVKSLRSQIETLITAEKPAAKTDVNPAQSPHEPDMHKPLFNQPEPDDSKTPANNPKP